MEESFWAFGVLLLVGSLSGSTIALLVQSFDHSFDPTLGLKFTRFWRFYTPLGSLSYARWIYYREGISLFGHLIAIRSLDPLWGFWRLVRRGFLSPSLSAQLIAPYKSADENLGFEANCATKMNFQTGSKG